MRIQAHLLLGMVALAIPAAVAAAPFGDNDAGYAVAGGQPRCPAAPPIITEGSCIGVIASNASVPTSRLMMAWTWRLPRHSSRRHGARTGDGRTGRVVPDLPGKCRALGHDHDGRRSCTGLCRGRRPRGHGQQRCTGLRGRRR